jgi:hypothetical protein
MVAIVALAAPVSHAQCPSVRSFGASGGKVGSTVVVDATTFQNNGNELAQFWETGNPANTTGAGAGSTCPSQTWWGIHGATGHRLINGFVSVAGCVLPINGPPVGGSLTFLIEDQTADGSNAGFIAYQVDETPAGQAWWDLSRTDPNAGMPTLLTP